MTEKALDWLLERHASYERKHWISCAERRENDSEAGRQLGKWIVYSHSASQPVFSTQLRVPSFNCSSDVQVDGQLGGLFVPLSLEVSEGEVCYGMISGLGWRTMGQSHNCD